MVDNLVSIILPIYNIKEEFLRKCVNSLLKQTEKNIEIILINDGSSNNALEVCRELETLDERINVLDQPNNGVSVARNNGLYHAKGDYICFIDPDDWVQPEYISSLLAALKKSGADFSVCDCNVCYADHNTPNRFLNCGETILNGNAKNKLMYQLVGKKLCEYYPPEVACGVPWGKMFRADFIKKNELAFIPGMVRMQDNIFCLYAIQVAENIHYIPEKLYNYRKETGSACYKFNSNIVKYFEHYFDETFKFLKKFNREKIMFRAFEMKELTSFNSFFTQYFFHKDNDKSFSKIKAEINELLSHKRYAAVLSHVDYSLLTKQEILFVFLMKHRQYRILKLIVTLRGKFKM